MKILHNLLSNKLHTDAVNVPVSRTDPSKGVVRVTIKQIEGDRFDDLWDAINTAEKEANKEPQKPIETGSVVASRKSREERRIHVYQAWEAVLEACVEDNISVLAAVDSLAASLMFEDFLITLLNIIKQYQSGVLLSAERIWEIEAAPLVTPLDSTT
jgi:hypothetical protein